MNERSTSIDEAGKSINKATKPENSTFSIVF